MNSRSASLRVLLCAATVLAFGINDAAAVSVNAMIDGIGSNCADASNIVLSTETNPVWTWSCGAIQFACVQTSNAVLELDTANVVLQCLTSIPANNSIFDDTFD